MLIPDNVHPEQTIYYNGSVVLNLLYEHAGINMVDLYLKVKELHNMNIAVFILCIDWLYLLDVVEVNSKNEVVLCSLSH